LFPSRQTDRTGGNVVARLRRIVQPKAAQHLFRETNCSPDAALPIAILRKMRLSPRRQKQLRLK